jgi:hypothetical protein
MRCLIAALLLYAAPAYAIEANGPEHDGKPARVVLPSTEHLKNVGGSDGAGLCVFASGTHAARYQSVALLEQWMQWMRKYPGGGYPSKVDTMLKRIASEKGVPVPPYVQHTGGDPDFLELALRTGRYPCVTYDGRDGVFYRGRIAHMVNLVYLDDETAAIHDNNYPGKWLWMTRSEFLSRWNGNGGGWAYVLLEVAPPPLPSPQFTPIQWGTNCAPRSRSYTQPYYVNPQPAPFIQPYVVPYTPQPVPVVEPQPQPVVAEEIKNYGLDLDKIPQEKGWSKNGRPCDKEECFEAFGDGLIDDSTQPHLTWVGDKGSCDNFLRDAKTLPNIRVHAYEPSHWRVRQSALSPGLTMHEPSDSNGRAKVKWHLTSYESADLARLVREGPRKPDPSPSPLPPLPSPSLPWELPTWMLWVAALVALLLRDTLARVPGWLWSLVPSRSPQIDAAKLDELLKRLKELETK